jgi:hypothetical protein
VVTISTPGGTVIGTYSVDVSYNANLENDSSDGLGGGPYTLTASVNDADGNSLFSRVTSSEIPYSITTPFGPIDLGENAGSSQLMFDCTTTIESGTLCDGSITADLTVQLTNASSTVPEPSTWIMMAVGFAGLGFAGYRRAKAPAIA